MNLKVACSFVIDLNSSSDSYIEFKLLFEDDIMKLNLDDYIEDKESFNILTDEAMFDYECMEIFNRFHKIEYIEDKAIYSRIVGIELNCKENNVRCLLNILNDYGFDNFPEIEQKIREEFNFKESFKFKKKKRKKRKSFGKREGNLNG